MPRSPVSKFPISYDVVGPIRASTLATAIAVGFALVLNLVVFIAGVHWYFTTPHGPGAKLDTCVGENNDTIAEVVGYLGGFIGLPIVIWAFIKLGKASTPLLVFLAIAAFFLNLAPEQLNAEINKVMIASHPAGVSTAGCTE